MLVRHFIRDCFQLTTKILGLRFRRQGSIADVTDKDNALLIAKPQPFYGLEILSIFSGEKHSVHASLAPVRFMSDMHEEHNVEFSRSLSKVPFFAQCSLALARESCQKYFHYIALSLSVVSCLRKIVSCLPTVIL